MIIMSSVQYILTRKTEPNQGTEARKTQQNRPAMAEMWGTMRDTSNIYRAARMEAAQREPLFSSRERAAAVLYVSTEALQDYETGKSLPPCDVVQRMVEEYGADDLKRQHIRSCCPLLPDYGSDNESGLARAALSWMLEFSGTNDIAQRFAVLARDGRITPDEIEAARTVRAKAVELRQIMEDTIAAIDKAIREGVQP